MTLVCCDGCNFLVAWQPPFLDHSLHAGRTTINSIHVLCLEVGDRELIPGDIFNVKSLWIAFLIRFGSTRYKLLIFLNRARSICGRTIQSLVWSVFCVASCLSTCLSMTMERGKYWGTGSQNWGQRDGWVGARGVTFSHCATTGLWAVTSVTLLQCLMQHLAWGGAELFPDPTPKLIFPIMTYSGVFWCTC